jgi:outer membrane receptor protein involved in Fe transport
MDPNHDRRTAAPAGRKALAIAVSATAAMVSQGARAELEEIIVTATKRAQSLQEVPQSVQAFSTEDIRKQHLVGIDDYSKKIPALSFVSREPADFRSSSAAYLSRGSPSARTHPAAFISMNSR